MHSVTGHLLLPDSKERRRDGRPSPRLASRLVVDVYARRLFVRRACIVFVGERARISPHNDRILVALARSTRGTRVRRS